MNRTKFGIFIYLFLSVLLSAEGFMGFFKNSFWMASIGLILIGLVVVGIFLFFSKNHKHRKYDMDIDIDNEKDQINLRKIYKAIGLLNIKSANMSAKEEAYQLSNMLHKLTNELVATLKSKNHSLAYKISTDVPRYLVGDVERLYQVLCGILSTILLQSKNSVASLSLEIKDEVKLLFTMTNQTQIFSKKEIKNLFLSPAKKVNFSVIKEVVTSMKGHLEVENLNKMGTQFRLEIPYILDIGQKSNKDELRNILANKQAMVVDKNISDSKIVTDVLESLRLKVSFLSSGDLVLQKPNLDAIDFLIIKAEDITQNVFSFFKGLHKNDTNIIVISGIYDVQNSIEITSFIADAQLYSPLIVGDVEEVFKTLLLKEKKNEYVVRDELLGFEILDVASASKRDFQMFKEKNILIVEDNFIDLQMMSNILNSTKMNIFKVENGKEALNFLDTHEDIDLIFMDMHMPIMNGFQTSSKIRKHQVHTEVPIVAVTAVGDNYEKEQMILSGISACIVKPYKVGQFYVALERFLNQEGLNKVYVEVNTPKIKLRLSILDESIGIEHTRGEDLYSEMLSHAAQTFKNSDVLVREMIIKDQLAELKTFCVDTVGLSATIGATSFVALLNAMLHELSKRKKDVRMSEYITRYESQWSILEEEIKRYLMK